MKRIFKLYTNERMNKIHFLLEHNLSEIKHI